jgi:hypothetical protein
METGNEGEIEDEKGVFIGEFDGFVGADGK